MDDYSLKKSEQPPRLFTLEGEVWKARAKRRWERAGICARDLGRDLEWSLGGGAKFFRRYGRDVAAAHKWCFVVGCNNSGTSLLQSILEKSGHISTFPLEGQRYTRVLERSERKGYERVWSEYLDDLRLTERDPLSGVDRLIFDWIRELPMPLNNIIVEKTPANAVRMRWLQLAFPNVYFIGLVRDGYAVCEGIRRKGFKSINRAARHWKLVNSIMMDDAKSTDRFLEVRYEDLVSDSEGSAERLAEFLGLDVGRLKSAMSGTYSFNTIEGNQDLRVVNLNKAAKSRLSDRDQEIIRQEAGEVLDLFGYAPDST